MFVMAIQYSANSSSPIFIHYLLAYANICCSNDKEKTKKLIEKQYSILVPIR